MAPETPPGEKLSEGTFYNPPTMVRQNHMPSWLNTIMGMFQGSVRPEQRSWFSNIRVSRMDANRGRQAKAILKRRRLRDIARNSRRRNREA